MDLEKVKALLSDNSEAQQFVSSLAEKAENATQLTEKVNSLELKANEAITSRQQLKELIKNTTGLSEVSEDALKGLLDNKSKGDDKSMAEINNLKKLLEEASNESKNISQTYEQKLQKLALDNALANAGLGANVANEAMYGIVAQLVKDGATYENDSIVYKNADGTTKYGNNGKPMTINDRVAELKSDTNYAGLFKLDVKSGSSTPPTTTQTKVVKTISRSQFESMNPADKASFFANGGTLTDN